MDHGSESLYNMQIYKSMRFYQFYSCLVFIRKMDSYIVAYLYIQILTFLILFQSLCGATLQIPTIDGRRIPLRLTEVIKPNSVKRIQGEGLLQPKQNSRRGDLIIEFDVNFPGQLSQSAKEILSDCLPRS